MDLFWLFVKSIILGIVEGVTEFLPVSSTGHLIIFENLLHFKGASPLYVEMYTFVIQLGAILAVIILYRGKIIETLVNFFPQKTGFEKSGFRFWLMIAIACIPGFVCQMLFDNLAERYLFNAISVAVALFVGGVWMIYMERRLKDRVQVQEDLVLTVKQALIVGTFQCLAVIPGMSRSASTIIGGWVSGLSTVAAAEFSFFLAIPVMLGMSLLKVIKIGGLGGLTGAELISLAAGFVTAFLVALVVVERFIAYLKKKPMKVFAYYRMAFAVLVVAAGLLGVF